MTPEIPSVTRRLKRVAPLQLGKMLAVLYGVMGLIFVPFFLLFSVLGAMAPARSGAPAALPIVFGLGFAVAMPLMYAVMGFITGVVGAWIYNLVAKWLGGIEVEVE